MKWPHPIQLESTHAVAHTYIHTYVPHKRAPCCTVKKWCDSSTYHLAGGCFCGTLCSKEWPRGSGEVSSRRMPLWARGGNNCMRVCVCLCMLRMQCMWEMVICVYIICEPVPSFPVWRWIASFCCSSTTEHCSKVPRKRAQCQCEWQKLCKY